MIFIILQRSRPQIVIPDPELGYLLTA